MATIKKDKEFDCVKMKNDIQAEIYAETKDMNFHERRVYIDRQLQGDSFWTRIQKLPKAKMWDRFVRSCPENVDLTDEEIMEEVRAVRYD
jgi:hypothetical protein